MLKIVQRIVIISLRTEEEESVQYQICQLARWVVVTKRGGNILLKIVQRIVIISLRTEEEESVQYQICQLARWVVVTSNIRYCHKD